MAQTGYTPIQLYYSTTAAVVPVNTNLVNGELAINIIDGKLYYKDNTGVVKLLASNASTTAVNTLSFGTTGLTPSTAAGTLAVVNGGTGVTASTGTGSVVRNTSPTLVTPALGTPSSGTLTNCTFPTLNQNTSGSAATFTSTSQNSQFNSIGVGTAGSGTGGEIRATNNITAFYSSDAKFKESIQPITGASEIIRAIGADYFDWTDDYISQNGGEDGYFIRKSDFGVIAQKVQAVFPKAVRTRSDGSLAVDYPKLGVLSFSAIIKILDRLDVLDEKVFK